MGKPTICARLATFNPENIAIFWFIVHVVRHWDRTEKEKIKLTCAPTEAALGVQQNQFA